MADVNRHARILVPLGLMLATVVLQLVVALILDLAANRDATLDLLTVATILGAIALHGIRFVIWGYAHRYYPLSLTYPLTALFFPLVLVLAYWRGEELAAAQVAGTILITAGVALTAWGSGTESTP